MYKSHTRPTIQWEPAHKNWLLSPKNIPATYLKTEKHKDGKQPTKKMGAFKKTNVARFIASKVDFKTS